MLGNAGHTPLIEAENFVPLEAYGMAVLSIGHLTGDHNTPVAWRGPKATGALMQLFNQTLWPELDVLVIDMPPEQGYTAYIGSAYSSNRCCNCNYTSECSINGCH